MQGKGKRPRTHRLELPITTAARDNHASANEWKDMAATHAGVGLPWCTERTRAGAVVRAGIALGRLHRRGHRRPRFRRRRPEGIRWPAIASLLWLGGSGHAFCA